MFFLTEARNCFKPSESLALIKRYEDQQNNVRNNREYDSLTKEIEFQKQEVKQRLKNKRSNCEQS